MGNKSVTIITIFGNVSIFHIGNVSTRRTKKRRHRQYKMIVSIGEILADMVGKKAERSIRFKCFAGGAPFNVACGVAKLGGNVKFIGCVGKDEIGIFLKEYAADVVGLDSEIYTDSERNTTLAFVTLSESGERSFSFFRKNTADYALDISMVKPSLEKADIVHIGSLMLSEKRGRMFAEEVAALVKGAGKLLSFDVNFREDIFESKDAAKAVYAPWLERADILKLSEEESEMFFGKDGELPLLKLSSGKKIFVTLGKKGAKLYENGTMRECGTIDVRVVDTNGAGDAFYAGVLRQIDGGEKDGGRILRYANVCGALTTAKYGATESLPCGGEVVKYL